jgi:cysteine desulfurase
VGGKKKKEMKRIYLDHAATTPMSPEALEAMLPHLTSVPANPSSLHMEGRAARAALDGARTAVSRCLNAKPREIVFTSGGTEANNLAIFGIARARRADGTHLITSAIEHRATLRAFTALRDEGFTITELPVDGEGRVDPQDFARAITPRTTFASIMFANNEIGTLQPVAELAAIAREHRVVFHADAVQAAGKITLDVTTLGVDLLSLSAHKFEGPKGTGILYVRQGTPIVPLLVGGSQESGLRAGTENLPGIVGCATALESATTQAPQTSERLAFLRDRFETGVRAFLPDARINGAGADRLPNISSVGFPEVDARDLLVRLDLEGIAASAGSACAAGVPEASHVLAALGTPARTRGGVVRFSLGRMTTEDEIASVLNRLPGIVQALRAEAFP